MNKEKIIEWLIEGKTGISSKTMASALIGKEISKFYGDKPYDPDDFSRCYNLFILAELTTFDMNLIAGKLPYWKPYIENWSKLVEMFEKNKKENWENSKEIGMYEFMQELRKESDIIKYNEEVKLKNTQGW